MSTFTWTTGANGDWTTAAAWTSSTVPDATNAAAVLPGVSAGGYTVTIGVGESEIVNAITIGDLSGSHAVGPIFDVAGTLSFAGAGALADFFRGALRIDSTGMLEGAARLPYSFGVRTGFNFKNNGAVLADTGSFVLDASAGLVSNFSNGTLSSGTWIARGFFLPGAMIGTFNLIAFGASPQAGIVYAPGATFNVSNVGTTAVVANTSGAPPRQDFAFTLSVNDSVGLSGSLGAEIVNNLTAAAEDWAQYLTGHTTLRIQLDIVGGKSGAELATGSPSINISNGTTLDSRDLDLPSSLIALNTGNYVQGQTSDITIDLLAGNLDSIYVNPAPTPMPSGNVPSGEFDLVTVFQHELHMASDSGG